MPAHKKYLTPSYGIRILKLLAASVGSYAVVLSFHVLLTLFFPKENVIITSLFTGFLLWVLLAIWVYIAKKVGWVWLTYVGLTLVFTSLYYLLKA